MTSPPYPYPPGLTPTEVQLGLMLNFFHPGSAYSTTILFFYEDDYSRYGAPILGTIRTFPTDITIENVIYGYFRVGISKKYPGLEL